MRMCADKNIGRCSMQSLCEVYSIMPEHRKDLQSYKFKARTYMRGDTRRANLKIKKQQPRSAQHTDCDVDAGAATASANGGNGAAGANVDHHSAYDS